MIMNFPACPQCGEQALYLDIGLVCTVCGHTWLWNERGE